MFVVLLTLELCAGFCFINIIVTLRLVFLSFKVFYLIESLTLTTGVHRQRWDTCCGHVAFIVLLYERNNELDCNDMVRVPPYFSCFCNLVRPIM